MEKDGSSLSDEKQTIQTSLFAMLKDFLKSPTPEELHSVLAYILTVGEEQQVCFIHLFSGVQFCNHLTFSERYFTFNPNVNSPIHPHGLCYSCVLISTLPL